MTNGEEQERETFVVSEKSFGYKKYIVGIVKGPITNKTIDYKKLPPSPELINEMIKLVTQLKEGEILCVEGC